MVCRGSSSSSSSGSQADQERLLEEEKHRQDEQLKVGFTGFRSDILSYLQGDRQLLGFVAMAENLGAKRTARSVIFRNGRSILAPKSFCTPAKLTQT